MKSQRLEIIKSSVQVFSLFLATLPLVSLSAQSESNFSGFPESYSGMVWDFHSMESILKDSDNPQTALEILKNIRTGTKGLQATVERSSFSFCSLSATSRYGIRKYTKTTSFPNLRKWEKAELQDNNNDFVSFIFVTHDYGEAIFCKRFDNTGDSFQFNMKLCTTADDNQTGLKKMENPAAVCAWMRK